MAGLSPQVNASAPGDAVWQASPLPLATLDADTVVTTINPAGQRFFAGSPVGTPLLDLVHPMDRGALTQMLQAASAGSVPARQEIRFRRPDGVVVVAGFNVGPLDPRTPGPTMCVIRDLATEQALRPNLLHAERLASIGLIATTVAHELNNPLAGASGCVELLLQTCQPEQRELLTMAFSEIRRAAQIVGDLNSYARRSEGLSDEVRPCALLRRMKRLRGYEGRSSVRVEIDCDSTLPPIRGNVNQLLQALTNLVRNAEQAVSDGPPDRQQVTVRATRCEDTVLIEVCDRGPGITPEARLRLFEPFYSTKQPGEGTGLGLCVVQSVAHGHGGRVEVYDTPGGGSTFALVLPILRPASQQRRRSAALQRRPRWPRGTRLLVADDEQVIRTMIARACRHMDITAAVDAADAIAALDRQRGWFDAVLLDVRMPRGGGAAVFDHITAHHTHLVSRTVFMSGAIDHDMTAMVGSGYAAALDKPFELDALIDVLEQALGVPPPHAP